MDLSKQGNLRNTSYTSITKGLLSPEEVAKLAHKAGQSWASLTDDGKTFGLIAFYEQAKKLGIKPIMGVDFWIENDITQKGGQKSKILLIAKSNEGYLKLLDLVTKAQTTFKDGQDRHFIKESYLKDNGSDLICLSGNFTDGQIPTLMSDFIALRDKFIEDKQKNIDTAFTESEIKLKLQQIQNTVKFYKETFKEDFFLEVQRYGLENEDEIIVQLAQLSEDANIPLVATNPTEFSSKKDFFANCIRQSISNKTMLHSEENEISSTAEQYFKSPAEMREVFKGLEVACDNVEVIVDRCNATIKLGAEAIAMPHFPIDVKDEISAELLNQLPTKKEQEDFFYRQEINKVLTLTAKHYNWTPEHPDYQKLTQHWNEFESAFKTDEENARIEKLEAVVFERMSLEGFEKILERLPENEREKSHDQYFARLQEELGCIKQMKFGGYFLIVQDVINWALRNDIPIGPGRGSGAGSLVAFSLGITNVDPIKHSLFFERFLNPERVSLPDFDIDVGVDDSDKVMGKKYRTQVIQYIADRFGREHVSQIWAPSTMKIKSILLAVGKTLGVNPNDRKRLNNALNVNLMIGYKEDDPAFVSEMLKANYEVNDYFRHLVDTNNEFREVYELGLQISSFQNSIGVHAGGIFISQKPVEFYGAKYDADGKDIVQLDKNDLEHAGGVKFDFLGLRSLNVIQQAVDAIKADGLLPRDYNIFVEIDKHINDPKILQQFCEGDTIGIFQFEGFGVTNMITKIKPTSFEDVTAATALNRPGPLESGMDATFINRKNGVEKVFYPMPECDFPELEDILGNTRGVIVYQEQVMQVAQKIAGYTLGGADMLRRAMGKKKPEEMAKELSKFVSGAEKNGYPAEKAKSLFDIIEKFAGYGFNKSHSVAYTYVTMIQAFLKKNYPSYYYASLINHDNSKANRKCKIFLEDAKLHGIEIAPISINDCEYLTVSKNGKLQYGFSKIGGVDAKTAEEIVNERNENGPFKDFADFYMRCLPTATVAKNLVLAGAFDEWGERGLFLSTVAKWGKERDKQNNSTRKNLRKLKVGEGDPFFDGIVVEVKKQRVLDNPFERIGLAEEFQTLSQKEMIKEESRIFGFGFKYSYFDAYYEKFDGLKAISPFFEQIDKLDTGVIEGRERTLIAGVVEQVKEAQSKKGWNITLKGNANPYMEEDEVSDEHSEDNPTETSNEVEKRFFFKNELLEQHGIDARNLKEGDFFCFAGNMQPQSADQKARYGGNNTIFPDYVMDENALEIFLTDHVNVLCEKEDLKVVETILSKYQGNTPVRLYSPDSNGEMEWRESNVKIALTQNNLQELREIFSEDSVKCSFKTRIVPPQPLRNAQYGNRNPKASF